MALLELKGVSKFFGGLAALSDVSFQVQKGEIMGLIGPNGSGKTTTFNVATGVLRPSRGNIFLNGVNISKLRPDLIVKKGMGRTFQANVSFKDETCLNNLLMAQHLRLGVDPWGALLNLPRARTREADARQRAMELLGFVGLSEVKDEPAGKLPHGYQRALGVTLALSTEPQLLLLDEPATGLNPEEIKHITVLIKKLREERGITIVLVEHNMSVVMGISDRIVVLSYGKKIAEGLPKEITENKDVIEAYLGTGKKGPHDA